MVLCAAYRTLLNTLARAAALVSPAENDDIGERGMSDIVGELGAVVGGVRVVDALRSAVSAWSEGASSHSQ